MAARIRKQKMKKRAAEEAVDSDDSFDLSDSEDISEDSDVELQKAFVRKDIKAGLNYETAAPKSHINNEEELKDKLTEIQLNLDWIERLDVSCDGNKRLMGQEEDAEEVHDDFRREMGFYRQAQHAVLEALPKLHELGIATKRPEDYFAEMAKSDIHMRKVREKLIAKQLSLERSEKAKKLRELRKFGKKVKHEVMVQRSREKKQLMDSVKQFKKGNKDSLNELLDVNSAAGGKKGAGNVAKRKGGQQKDAIRRGPGKKRQYKDDKWGRGGKKDKRNNLKKDDGRGNRDGFNYKSNHSDVFKAKGKAKATGGRKGFKKNKEPTKRVGKNRRKKLSSRKK